MSTTVESGSNGAAVREAQYLLARYHYLDAPGIDGIFGPRTDAAVCAFQESEGLTVDGVVGPHTWGALLAVFSIPPTLDVGASGDLVLRVQEVLDDGRPAFDPSAPPLVTDGVYGPRTRAMVASFQRWGGVGTDGVVGLQTWAVSLHAAGEELATVVGV